MICPQILPKLSANIHDFSANLTKIVCKCCIKLEFYTPAFRGFFKPGNSVDQDKKIFLYKLLFISINPVVSDL